MFRLVSMLSALVLSGCCAPDLTVEPSVRLGSGEVEFVPLSDGAQEVDLVNGIQGGWHVWGSVRVAGLDWTDVRLDFSLSAPGGELVSAPSRTQAELSCCTEDDCDGVGELVGFPVLVDEPVIAQGRNLTLAVVVTDPEGRTATADRAVIPVR